MMGVELREKPEHGIQGDYIQVGKKERIGKGWLSVYQSRRRGVILAEGDLLNGYVLDSIGIGLELIDVQHEDIALNLLQLVRVSTGKKNNPSTKEAQLTSIRQKLGVGSSPAGQNPELMAPVALPGLIKKRPSNSKASNRCVPPQSRISTSIWRAAIRSASASPGGMMV